MRSRIPTLFAAAALLFSAPMLASEPLLTLADYLPEGVQYRDDIPQPKDVLGFEPGEWHVRPDQLVAYARTIAEATDRATFEIQGRTHEKRAQPLLIFTSPSNHARLETLRLAHLALLRDDTPPADLDAMPLVVLQGFSIHGNEPSGANSSPLLMYHLAAAQGPEIEELLQKTIILVDPSFNPDGLGRFAHWANTNRGHVVSDDPEHREHREPWPRGRTNHYLFDLNRDWLLAQHPESRNRLRTFHRWRPNVVTDHHEMGSGSTFFFQPGVPIRKNPRIPERNVELTNRIAEHHAASFDAAGRLYYTEEGFDDFYPGKGSTYPDLHGSVGILFEQASSRGHAQRTATGSLTFPFTIQNQFRAALSTLSGAAENRRGLLELQIEFAANARRDAARSDIRGFLVNGLGDPTRLEGFARVLDAHTIEMRTLAADATLGEHTVPGGGALFVAVDQPQYTLILSLFERLNDFADSTFYDVSTWNLPMAFGLDTHPIDSAALGALELGPVWKPTEPSAGPRVPEGPAVAYALDWTDAAAAKVAGRLQRAGVEVRVATRPMRARTARGQERFEAGTLLVPAGGERAPRESLETALEGTPLQVTALETGWTAAGPDLGSNQVVPLRPVHPLLVSGDPAASYSTGEIWHLLDRRFEMPVSLVDFEDLARTTLSDYSHVLIPDGSYQVSDELLGKLQAFMRQGGFVIALQGAAGWLDRAVRGRESGSESEPSDKDAPAPDDIAHADYAQERAKQLLRGAIFEVELDLTHPLAWGYQSSRLPVFRTSTLLLPRSQNPFLDVARYTASPRLSGYASPENVQRLAGTVGVAAGRVGRGGWVQIADPPAFRAVWWGPSRMVLNALFFSHTISATSAPSTWN